MNANYLNGSSSLDYSLNEIIGVKKFSFYMQFIGYSNLDNRFHPNVLYLL